MQSPLETRLTMAAAVGAVVLSVLAVWYWQRGTAPDAAVAAASAPNWEGPIGPGLARGLPPPVLDAAPSSEPGLALDASGHLVAGPALRKLFDSYLARGAVTERSTRSQQLRAYLQGKPGGAEAERIAGTYLQYLEAEDRLLAREDFRAAAMQHLAERDVERLLAFRDQRTQVRDRMLGPVLARSWFEVEDSRCDAAFREWRLQHVEPEAGQELDPVELREQRIHGAAMEARRDADAQECAGQMSRNRGG